MDNWFKSKWFVRAISLFFAVLLFVVVEMEETKFQTDSRVPSGSDKVEVLEGIPVDIQIDSEKFVVSGVPEFVTLSLEGSAGHLTPVIMTRNFEVFVDLREYGEGKHTVDIEYAKIPSELSVYIEPKTVEVEIEERASEEFAVDVDFINIDQLPEGYELGDPEIKPENVRITSSRSVIDQIAIVKVYIDVADLTESINNREVPVNIYDSQGNGLNVRVEPSSVVASVPIDNPSKKVPLEVETKGELPEDYSLVSITSEVEEVEVFAVSAVLDELEVLTTEDIDLSEVSESGEYEAKVDIGEGMSVNEETVKVIIEIEQTKVIEDVAIEVKNADDQEILFIDPDVDTMNVEFVGSDEKVKAISTDDFQLFIDVKGLEKGEHKVPVSIEGPDDVTSSVEFEQITIEIT
ncbi:MAG TPA: CdaR family protein [Candidatus Dormibacteraeota bacterium]|nr:CdaR family protein [Candidatus Dormibacteraeota bacterium]